MKYAVSCDRLRGLVNAWRAIADKGEGGAFRQCAQDLDAVITETKAKARKKGKPFYLTVKLKGGQP